MPTIYRFIVEQKTSAERGGRKDTSASNGGAKKGAAKKGKWVSIFGGGGKGGVEANRKLRAVNPLINKATGGGWEKGMRFTRAATGLVQRNSETGKLRVSGTALTILIQMGLLLLLTLQKNERDKAQKENAQNYKQLENGYGAIHGAYDVSTNIISGRHTYNQNK